MNVFANLKFPEYKYQEYPKWVKRANGKEVIVQNQREEIDLIATDGEAPKNNDADREKEALQAHIRELELKLAQANAPALKAAADTMVNNIVTQAAASVPLKPKPDPKSLQQPNVIADLAKP